VFQSFKLVRGTWEVKNEAGKVELVRPQDIKNTALLTVEGELDDISGSGQTLAAHTLCTGVKREALDHLEAKGAGHYGIFSGRRWRDIVYPHVKAFILSHNKAAPKAATKAATPATQKASPTPAKKRTAVKPK
jgi:poly(3-hydroxybutyrate) depolymerase